jgi:hypothetical protein
MEKDLNQALERELVVSGPDAFKFLQSQLTCDLRELSNTRALAAALCDQKGRVQAVVIIYQHPVDQSYRLIGPVSEFDFLLSRLKKYAVFSKLTFKPAESFIDHVKLSESHEPFQLSMRNNQVISISYPDQSKQRALVIYPQSSPSPSPSPSLSLSLSLNPDQDIMRENQLDWIRNNIYAKWPILSEKTRDLFTPHMLGLEKIGGVSFSKGCYLGQEIVARTEHLGKVKRHLYQLKLSTKNSVKAGDTLSSLDKPEETLGWVISAVDDLALAVIEDRTITDTLQVIGHSTIAQVIKN